MSSRSPSPPRRTVIGSSSSRSDDSGSGSKTHVEDLVKTRNRKLVELYCMSRLSELLTIRDEKALKAEMDSFLRQNDIKKGLRFRSDTLPRQLWQAGSPMGTDQPGSVVGSAKKAPRNVDAAKKVKNEQPRSSTADSYMAQKVKSELKRPLTESAAGELPPEKKLKINRDTRPNTLESGTKSHSSSVPNLISSADEFGKARSASIYASPIPSVPNRPIYYPDIDITPAEPTPLGGTKKCRNYLVDEVSRKSIEPMDYFKENNINSKESVYLLMKEIVPSEIPQALPLAELKYMVQTLPLIKLIPMAHKVLTTDIMNNALSEGRITVVSSRIEELRRLGLWSLRQPKKFVDAWQEEPSHYRTLIEEAKWMQADFKEGRKYKIAVCATIAHAVMEYWSFGKVCCISRRPIKHLSADAKDETSVLCSDTAGDSSACENVVNHTQQDRQIQPIELAGNEPGSSSGELDTESIEATEQNVTSVLDEKQAAEAMCNEKVEAIDVELLKKGSDSQKEHFPTELTKDSTNEKEDDGKRFSQYPFKLHLSFDELNKTARTIAQEIPLYIGTQTESNALESLPFVAVSKSLVTLEDDHFLKLVEKQIVEEEQSLVQLSKRRGMFYGNRRSHYLKPPPAPSLKYLQNRTPTIWLPEDDQELVKNINAYAYNWELISAHMTHRPTMSYFSNIERRTPWQCFERFVQLNERFSFSDLKGPRAHSVHQWLLEAHKFQQKQNRRISPLGVGPESIQRGHRRLRWASMFEAMRKNIKKRENAPRPNPTQPRKPLDCKNMKVPTPAEMSQLKAQRDEALRRDIQMRRNVKSRLQQKSSQSSPNVTQSRVANKPGMDYVNSSLPRDSGARQVSAPAPSQRPLTEREIVESYSRKILAQKPELSLETAMKAAQSYYKSGQQRRMQLQQQQQKLSPHIQAASAPVQPTERMEQKVKATTNHLKPNHSAPNPDMKSPTPQEILERFQK
ncbi:hypothetical protein HG536_0E00830 [Torulaspora globosa]|uniref:Chromatin modification-related protein EAF1 n=1 Tax=Torulaspora globosa TaxID=48254 RepID=A0A7G3ZI36_9SACH|nr:uncharacterized protein HG536_0E00830 [Torulaspora globosa]QLL33172.1 hypothetical protein HG536_0E00830 [Torulaspora globosa]